MKNDNAAAVSEVFEFLKKAGTFYIATIENANASLLPRVRLFSNINLFEGKIYVQTNKTKKVSAQILANNNIEIIAYDGEWWVRIAAKAVTDERIAPKQSMIDANPLLKDWFKADDDVTHVFYLAEAAAKFESLFGEPRTLTF